jgi:small ligand-binding sensory domain FIST
LQFCVRDNTVARQDLVSATERLRNVITTSVEQSATPLALFLLGSVERGIKVFRYQSWEANLVYQQLKGAGLESTVPVTGLQSYGAFARLQRKSGEDDNAQCALM